MNDCGILKSMSESIFDTKLVVLGLELVEERGSDYSSQRYKGVSF